MSITYDKATVISLIDLTNLSDEKTDRIQTITQLCQQAKTTIGQVAALCVWPEDIKQVKTLITRSVIRIATVVNFPQGDSPIEHVLAQTQMALTAGADEIDVVIRYQEYIAQGYSEYSAELVRHIKALCAEQVVKVIIESGELKTPGLISKASEDAIASGADFVKTSTGKTATGATLEAAEVILTTIKAQAKPVGFKASGGIKTYKQACAYLSLAEQICGKDYINPQRFRFGASSLLKQLID